MQFILIIDTIFYLVFLILFSTISIIELWVPETEEEVEGSQHWPED